MYGPVHPAGMVRLLSTPECPENETMTIDQTQRRHEGQNPTMDKA